MTPKKKPKRVGRPSAPSKNIIPVWSVKRLIKEEGAERVSIAAAKVLCRIVEAHARNIAKLSIGAAKAHGRTTVKAEDIEFVQKLRGEIR